MKSATGEDSDTSLGTAGHVLDSSKNIDPDNKSADKPCEEKPGEKS